MQWRMSKSIDGVKQGWQSRSGYGIPIFGQALLNLKGGPTGDRRFNGLMPTALVEHSPLLFALL